MIVGGMLACSAVMVIGGCAGSKGSVREDDEDFDDWGDEDQGGDRDGDQRRRKRRRRPAGRPVLIEARRVPGAVVERNRSGRPSHDVRELRSSLCEDSADEPVIFYQLIVSEQWHYYWLCSESGPQRVATPKGNRLLLAWVQDLERRAASKARDCGSGSRARMFEDIHDSGTRARAYCDGRIVLRFLDGGTKVRAFTAAARPRPPRSDADRGRLVCPRCPPCSEVRQACPDCPAPRPCPPPRQCPPAKKCPACDCSEQARKAGEKGFWQGVSKACKRICTLIYKKCRSIDSKTAMCYQLSEYCAETCAKR